MLDLCLRHLEGLFRRCQFPLQKLLLPRLKICTLHDLIQVRRQQVRPLWMRELAREVLVDMPVVRGDITPSHRSADKWTALVQADKGRLFLQKLPEASVVLFACLELLFGCLEVLLTILRKSPQVLDPLVHVLHALFQLLVLALCCGQLVLEILAGFPKLCIGLIRAHDLSTCVVLDDVLNILALALAIIASAAVLSWATATATATVTSTATGRGCIAILAEASMRRRG